MKRFPLWHLAVVAILCVAVYANALSGAFVWDDETQIVKLGTTVVVATHDLHLLNRIPNAQMMRLERGRLSDPTGALRYPPANRA